jgi:Fe-S oxidoreductase
MLDKFTEFFRQRINRPLQYYQDICVRCGACIDACHFYATSKDPAHIPAYRMMLVKKLTQNGTSGNGRLMNWYREFQERDAPSAAQLEKAIWECTGCRRCAVFCPFDLDTALLVSLGRAALLQENDNHGIIAEIGQAEVSKGEIIDDIKEFYIDQVKVLEKQLQEEFAPDLQIPVDKQDFPRRRGRLDHEHVHGHQPFLLCRRYGQRHQSRSLDRTRSPPPGCHDSRISRVRPRHSHGAAVL